MDHDPILSSVAASLKPAIDSLEKYRAEHGRYPAHLKNAEIAEYDDVFPVAEFLPESGWWQYSCEKDGTSYTLIKKTGWDSSLVYYFENGSWHWMWCPGGGAPEEDRILKL